MKILFAVNNDKISNAIVEKYKKLYNEDLEFKNVYYFNALISEVKSNKTYDRIVISEELELFLTSNYNEIDNFIFEKLDAISDEADDTDIILICTDRRTKKDTILTKLFGIGVYNLLIGDDRSIEQVCKLINTPKTKKEAKQYINFDSSSDDEDETNKVSELELKNILAHYKKLGNDYEKYSQSFSNIASQYNIPQLKIILNILPSNVKTVLEQKSDKYREVVRFIENLEKAQEKIEVPEEKKGKKTKKTKEKPAKDKKEKQKKETIKKQTSTKKDEKSKNINTVNIDAPPLNKPIIIPGVKTGSYKKTLDITQNVESSQTDAKIINLEQKSQNISKDEISFDASKKQTTEKSIVSIGENVPKSEKVSNFIPASGYSKIVSFVGASKTGTTFLVNLVANYFALKGVKTAILDLTKKKNSYYIYTKNEEELRKQTYECLNRLSSGVEIGLKLNNDYLTVFTTLPNDNIASYNINNMLNTLRGKYDVVLIDADFASPIECFENSEEIYAVQDTDILNIQDLTLFIRELKTRSMDLNKIKFIINKFIKSDLTEKIILGGISNYNDPEMKFMDNLFDVSKIKYDTIPFSIDTFKVSIDQIVNCKIDLRQYNAKLISCIKKIENKINTVNQKKTTPKKKENSNLENFDTEKKLSNKTEELISKMKQTKE